MIKKIRCSLFAKVFLITAIVLYCMALLVFGLLVWLMPQTYSNQLNTILDNRTQKFVSELEQVTFANSGGLFDQFSQNKEIHSVELYNSSGDFVPLPTEQFNKEWEVSIAQSVEDDFSENAPILSNHYYFSFSDSNDRYLLIVYGTAQQVAELQQSFARVFPLILFAVLIAAFAVSWLYSRMITKPVLAISRISEKMSDLQLDWKVDEQRADELGILGKSLNTLSHNLSTALSDLQSANRKLKDDIEQKKNLSKPEQTFFRQYPMS